MKRSITSRVAAVAVGGTLLASVFAFAPVASAAPLTTMQINAIVGLLQAFNANASTITTVRNVLESNTPSSGSTSGTTASTTSSTSGSTASSTSSTSTQTGSQSNGIGYGFGHIIQNMQNASTTCHVVSQHLHIGEDNQAVKQIQQFLSKMPGIYPQGIVSGYYGKLTEDAIRRWQAQHNIVATGTPSTTGFGIVGPETLRSIDHQMEVECESQSPESSASNSGDSQNNASSTVSSDGQPESSSQSASSTMSTDGSSSATASSSVSSSSDNQQQSGDQSHNTGGDN